MLNFDYLKKRILIFGASGRIGLRLTKFFLNHENKFCVQAVSFNNINKSIKDISFSADVTKREEIKKVIFGFYPDIIINAAGCTNVDDCESNREIVWRTNVKFVEYLTEFARTLDIHLIHFSSDYIFDGTSGPYSEKSKPNPLNYYGRTKLASENVLTCGGVLFTTFRINVPYGSICNKQDFVTWLIEKNSNSEKVQIVTDQYNNPTFIDDISSAVLNSINYKKYGIYNLGGREIISRYDFAMRISEVFNLNKNLISPVKTSELKQAALRPLNSGLITIKAETELDFRATPLDQSLELIKVNLEHLTENNGC